VTGAQKRALREYIFSLPGAHEDFPWGESVAKVQKTVFVFLGKPDDLTGVSVKLVRSHGYVASQAYASPTGYGLGKAGWLDIRFRIQGTVLDPAALPPHFQLDLMPPS
jgi:predicted DNA-binding protein (MmcQ/YjbR family)